MSNRILLISGNFYPEPTGIGKYSGEMTDWLAENGYSCTVITTFPFYPDWKVQAQYRKSRFWFKKEIRQPKNGSKPITIIRCPHYIPNHPTRIKRMLSEFTISFFSYCALIAILFTKKFDFVFTVAPPFELGLLGVLYKKIKGAIFCYHIQDLQIDAARDLAMIKSSLLLKLLFSIEKYILNNADHVSTISESMIKNLKLRYESDIIYFPNWVDTDFFYPITDKAKLKVDYGFNTTDKIILYSGAIGKKSGLESILQLAKRFDKNKQVKFVICGAGPYKMHLEKIKFELDLTNVIFYNLQPLRNFNAFLNIADVHLIFSGVSDLLTPSKLLTILSVGGVAIVTGSPGSSLYNITNSSDMGVLIEPWNVDALERSIEYVLNSDLTMKGNNARTYAQSNFSINEVLTRVATTVFQDPPREKNVLTKLAPVLVSTGKSQTRLNQEQWQIKLGKEVLLAFNSTIFTKTAIKIEEITKIAPVLVYAGQTTLGLELEQWHVKLTEYDFDREMRKKAEELSRNKTQNEPFLHDKNLLENLSWQQIEPKRKRSKDDISSRLWKKLRSKIFSKMISNRIVPKVPSVNAETVVCYFNAEIEAEVFLHQAVTVVVTVSRKEMETQTSMPSTKGKAKVEKSEKIIVEVIPKLNFIAIEDLKTYQEIDLSQLKESKKLFFFLRASNEGEGEILIVARQREIPVIKLKLKPKIIASKSRSLQTV